MLVKKLISPSVTTSRLPNQRTASLTKSTGTVLISVHDRLTMVANKKIEDDIKYENVLPMFEWSDGEDEEALGDPLT